jgi:MFS family permease
MDWRLVSGRLSERTGEFWPITLFGYLVQMSAVPFLALARSWQMAGLLIVVERIGKAIRNPPRDVMLSHAAKQIGYGWGFGLHEALDQFGALFGPLVVAAVLAAHGAYRTAFAVLLVPAVVTLSLIVIARLLYPRPEDMEVSVPNLEGSGIATSILDLPRAVLLHCHGGQRNWFVAVWAPLRSNRLVDTAALDDHCRRFDAAGFLGRLLAGLNWFCHMGSGNGRARIYHSSGSGNNGSSTTATVGLWNLHGWLRSVLVRRQCNHGKAL